MIIVFCYLECFEVVVKLFERYNLNFVKSLEVDNVLDDVNVILLDEMGKLNYVYVVVIFVFVGGFIVDRGGYNVFELVVFLLLIMMGFYIYNNFVICDYLKECGVLSIVEDVFCVFLMV